MEPIRVVRLPPIPQEDTIEVHLDLQDARTLHYLLTKGFPSNPYNAIWAFKERLTKSLEAVNITSLDL